MKCLLFILHSSTCLTLSTGCHLGMTSRDGRTPSMAMLNLWRLEKGFLVRSLFHPSECFLNGSHLYNCNFDPFLWYLHVQHVYCIHTHTHTHTHSHLAVNVMYQYFIKIVPTVYKTLSGEVSKQRKHYSTCSSSVSVMLQHDFNWVLTGDNKLGWDLIFTTSSCVCAVTRLNMTSTSSSSF